MSLLKGQLQGMSCGTGARGGVPHVKAQPGRDADKKHDHKAAHRGPAPVIVPTECFCKDTRAVDPNACVPFFQLRGFEGKFVSRHSTP